MIPDQYPNYYKALEIYTGYFDSLDIIILFSYPSSIVISRDYYIDLYSWQRYIFHIFEFCHKIKFSKECEIDFLYILRNQWT